MATSKSTAILPFPPPQPQQQEWTLQDVVNVIRQAEAIADVKAQLLFGDKDTASDAELDIIFSTVLTFEDQLAALDALRKGFSA